MTATKVEEDHRGGQLRAYQRTDEGNTGRGGQKRTKEGNILYVMGTTYEGNREHEGHLR